MGDFGKNETREYSGTHFHNYGKGTGDNGQYIYLIFCHKFGCDWCIYAHFVKIMSALDILSFKHKSIVPFNLKMNKLKLFSKIE